MGTVSTDLTDRARSIFADLGYSIEPDGPTFLAERGWKTVHVTPASAATEVPDGPDTFHCFVADPADADRLEAQLTSHDPAYEWAIIVVDGDDYAVERAPPVCR